MSDEFVKEVEKAESEDEVEEVKEEEKETFVDETEGEHIFGSKRSSHKIIVDYPDSERYFRAEFEKGVYRTTDDEKAKLLEEKVENNPNLRAVITKVQ